MSFVLSDRLSAKGTRESFGTLLSTRTIEMAVLTQLSSTKSIPVVALLSDFTSTHKGH